MKLFQPTVRWLSPVLAMARMPVEARLKHTSTKVKVPQAKRTNRRRLRPKRQAMAPPRRVISAAGAAAVGAEENPETGADRRGASVQSAANYGPNRRPRRTTKSSANLVTNFRTNLGMNLGTNLEMIRATIASTEAIVRGAAALNRASSGLRRLPLVRVATTITDLRRVINRSCFRANLSLNTRSNRRIRRGLKLRRRRTRRPRNDRDQPRSLQASPMTNHSLHQRLPNHFTNSMST